MYCPRCGQQQISAETKFCSRCGFQLHIVSELLPNNGTLPELEKLYSGYRGWLTRRNGVIFSLFWFLVFLFILTPIFGIADVDEMAGVSAILGVFGGLGLLIASLLLLRPASSLRHQVAVPLVNRVPSSMSADPARNALPPPTAQDSINYEPPAVGKWRAPDTGDLVRPGSVTEATTRLLKKDE